MSYYASYLGPDGFGTYEVDWDGPTPSFTRVHRPAKVLLVPGFVDLHIHGGFGIDFMSASHEELLVLCEKLKERGYEAFLPTTVSASADDVARSIGQLPKHEMILGFHLEGPFISEAYPGAQPLDSIVNPPLVDSEWAGILGHPELRLITLAPERPHALELISSLSSRGVVVSMGHTNATYEEARRGYEFGARSVTHMYNAMRTLHHREAGSVGYALINDSLNTELIYDRLHVSKEAAALLFKCKPSSRVVAVSDSTLATGMPGGQEIEMWGLQCISGDRQIRLKSNGALAGSAITLLDAFRNLAEDFGEETAIRACCLNPRLALGMPEEPRVYIEMNKKFEIVGRRARQP